MPPISRIVVFTFYLIITIVFFFLSLVVIFVFFITFVSIFLQPLEAFLGFIDNLKIVSQDTIITVSSFAFLLLLLLFFLFLLLFLFLLFWLAVVIIIIRILNIIVHNKAESFTLITSWAIVIWLLLVAIFASWSAFLLPLIVFPVRVHLAIL